MPLENSYKYVKMMRGGVVPRRWYAGASPAFFFKQELPGIGQELSRNNLFKRE